MHIGIVSRNNAAIWGGDTQLIFQLRAACAQLGHQVTLSSSAHDLLLTDVVLLVNSTLDHRENRELLCTHYVPYLVLCFHEDVLQYYLPSKGLASYVQRCMEGQEGFSLERIWESPELVCYFSDLIPNIVYHNFPVLHDARSCIANSPTEAKTIQRDCPSARTAIIPLPHETWIEEEGEKVEPLGLPHHSYLLQVGRLDTRKNQLATVLATRDVDLPLVFVATQSPQDWYEKLCVTAALRYRKAPTFFLSQNLPAWREGQVHVIPMPQGKRMPSAFMQELFANACAYIHPSFCELPGCVFFEAMRYQLPIVASEWCAIKDYVKEGGSEDIHYVLPYDIPAVERGVERALSAKRKERFREELYSTRSPLAYAEDLLRLIHTVCPG